MTEHKIGGLEAGGKRAQIGARIDGGSCLDGRTWLGLSSGKGRNINMVVEKMMTYF